MIVRILRWKAKSYRQVWLVYAPILGSGPLTGGLLAAVISGQTGKLLLSLPPAIVMFAMGGAFESYRLDRRGDAATLRRLG